METKEIKNNVPEGNEIDTEKSTFENIIYTKKYRKDLLLKDLCARLPYNVFVKDTYNGHYGRMYKITQGCVYYVSELNCNHLQSHPRCIKPYLRPMSSMTEEEKDEIRECIRKDADTIIEAMKRGENSGAGFYKMDFLNAHHFDYRGLIEKGLALAAPEGMYKAEKLK